MVGVRVIQVRVRVDRVRVDRVRVRVWVRARTYHTAKTAGYGIDAGTIGSAFSSPDFQVCALRMPSMKSISFQCATT